jgi:hypothetical protein
MGQGRKALRPRGGPAESESRDLLGRPLRIAGTGRKPDLTFGDTLEQRPQGGRIRTFRQRPGDRADIAVVFVARLRDGSHADRVPNLHQDLPDRAHHGFHAVHRHTLAPAGKVPLRHYPGKPAKRKSPSRYPAEGALIHDTEAGAPCPHTASASTPSMAAVT